MNSQKRGPNHLTTATNWQWCFYVNIDQNHFHYIYLLRILVLGEFIDLKTSTKMVCFKSLQCKQQFYLRVALTTTMTMSATMPKQFRHTLRKFSI